MTKVKVTLDPKEWKIKSSDRTKGRMKIQIKLNKEEAEFFKVWSKAVRPESVSEEEFIKRLLFKGIETMDQQLNELIQKTVQEMEHANSASSIEVEGKDLPTEEDVEEVE
jgi:hypothetical protein